MIFTRLRFSSPCRQYCIFTFEKGIAEGGDRPMVVTEAFQVIECTWARENNVELITAEHMDEINDKRAKEKKKA